MLLGFGCKIVDLSVDNLSQRLAERSQFGNLLARNGDSLRALIAFMKAEGGQPIG
jgi:hypothetical protein